MGDIFGMVKTVPLMTLWLRPLWRKGYTTTAPLRLLVENRPRLARR